MNEEMDSVFSMIARYRNRRDGVVPSDSYSLCFLTGNAFSALLLPLSQASCSLRARDHIS
jgi:hypothetical protein